jgi:hypothetical protein
VTAEILLNRLDSAKRTGTGRWIARCPAHDDRKPSLAVRELGDGRMLVHCFGGCDIQAVLGAVGLDFSSLYPEKPNADFAKRESRPFPAGDVLRAVQFEALVAAVGACNLAKGIVLSDVDRERVMVAAERLQAAGVLHE